MTRTATRPLCTNGCCGFQLARSRRNSTIYHMFSGAHLHLIVNHAPIFGSLFALALLVASYFAAPDVLRRTAFVVLIGTAIAGVAADLTGDPAQDAIRGFPGIRREVIHDHEEMGDKAY